MEQRHCLKQISVNGDVPSLIGDLPTRLHRAALLASLARSRMYYARYVNTDICLVAQR